MHNSNHQSATSSSNASKQSSRSQSSAAQSSSTGTLCLPSSSSSSYQISLNINSEDIIFEEDSEQKPSTRRRVPKVESSYLKPVSPYPTNHSHLHKDFSQPYLVSEASSFECMKLKNAKYSPSSIPHADKSFDISNQSLSFEQQWNHQQQDNQRWQEGVSQRLLQIQQQQKQQEQLQQVNCNFVSDLQKSDTSSISQFITPANNDDSTTTISQAFPLFPSANSGIRDVTIEVINSSSSDDKADLSNSELKRSFDNIRKSYRLRTCKDKKEDSQLLLTQPLATACFQKPIHQTTSPYNCQQQFQFEESRIINSLNLTQQLHNMQGFLNPPTSNGEDSSYRDEQSSSELVIPARLRQLAMEDSLISVGSEQLSSVRVNNKYQSEKAEEEEEFSYQQNRLLSEASEVFGYQEEEKVKLVPCNIIETSISNHYLKQQLVEILQELNKSDSRNLEYQSIINEQQHSLLQCSLQLEERSKQVSHLSSILFNVERRAALAENTLGKQIEEFKLQLAHKQQEISFIRKENDLLKTQLEHRTLQLSSQHIFTHASDPKRRSHTIDVTARSSSPLNEYSLRDSRQPSHLPQKPINVFPFESRSASQSTIAVSSHITDASTSPVAVVSNNSCQNKASLRWEIYTKDWNGKDCDKMQINVSQIQIPTTKEDPSKKSSNQSSATMASPQQLKSKKRNSQGTRVSTNSDAQNYNPQSRKSPHQLRQSCPQGNLPAQHYRHNNQQKEVSASWSQALYVSTSPNQPQQAQKGNQQPRSISVNEKGRNKQDKVYLLAVSQDKENTAPISMNIQANRRRSYTTTTS